MRSRHRVACFALCISLLGCAPDGSAHRERGLEALRAGEASRAIPLLEIALKQAENPETRLALARAQRETGQRAAALRTLQPLLDPESPAQHDTAFLYAINWHPLDATVIPIAEAIRLRAESTSAGRAILEAAAELEQRESQRHRRDLLVLTRRARGEGAKSSIQALAALDPLSPEVEQQSLLAVEQALGPAGAAQAIELRAAMLRTASARAAALTRAASFDGMDPTLALAAASAELDLGRTAAAKQLVLPILERFRGQPVEANAKAQGLLLRALDHEGDDAAIVALFADEKPTGEAAAFLARAAYRQRAPERLTAISLPIAETAPEDAWSQLFAGVGLLLQDQHARAMPLLQRTAALMEGHAVVHFWQGIALARAGQIEQASTQLAIAARLSPEDASVREAGSVALERAGALSAARELLLAAVPRDPLGRQYGMPPARIVRALVQSYARELNGLKDEEIETRHATEPGHVGFALAMAEFKLREGDARAALGLADIIIADMPWIPRAAALAALAALAVDEPAIAALRLSDLRSALDQLPASGGVDLFGSERALLKRLSAELARRRGDAETALALLGAPSLEPSDDELALRAHLYCELGRREEALEPARMLARRGPPSDEWTHHWIDLESEVGDLAIAEEILRASEPDEPLKAHVRMRLADAKARRGATAASEKVFKDVLVDERAEPSERLRAAEALVERKALDASDRRALRTLGDVAGKIGTDALCLQASDAAARGAADEAIATLLALRTRDALRAHNLAVALLHSPFGRPESAWRIAGEGPLQELDEAALSALVASVPASAPARLWTDIASIHRARQGRAGQLGRALDRRLTLRTLARAGDAAGAQRVLQGSEDDRAQAELAYADELALARRDQELLSFAQGSISPEIAALISERALLAARRRGDPALLRAALRLHALRAPSHPLVVEIEALLAHLDGRSKDAQALLDRLPPDTAPELRDAVALDPERPPRAGRLAAYAWTWRTGDVEARRRALAGLQEVPRSLQQDFVRIHRTLEARPADLERFARLLSNHALAVKETAARPNFEEEFGRWREELERGPSSFRVVLSWLMMRLGDHRPALAAWREAVKGENPPAALALLAIESFIESERKDAVDEVLAVASGQTGLSPSFARDVAELWLRRGHPDRASEVLGRVIAPPIELALLRVECEDRAGRVTAAQSLLQGIDPAASPGPLFAFLRARGASDRQERDAALAAIADDPAQEFALRIRAAADALDDARIMGLLRELTAGPHDLAALAGFVRSLAQSGRTPQSLRELQEALSWLAPELLSP